MFKEIFLFELSYRLKRISTYVYFAIWFLMGFLFSSLEVLGINDIGAKILKNSAYSISLTTSILMAFGIMITSSLVGTSVYRDFEQNTFPIFFTMPLKKTSYLGGRLLASLVLTMLVFSGISIGILLGSVMPWVAHDKMLPFRLMNYLQPFFLIVVPNVIFTGSLFFLVGTLSRSVLVVYLQSVVFFAIYFVTLILVGDLENQFWSSLLDPFAINSLDYVTKYWTIAEKNSLLIPVSGVMLYNRLLWLALGGLAVLAVFRFFSFSAENITLRKAKKQTLETAEPVITHQIELPQIRQHFNAGAILTQFLSLTRFRFLSIVKELSFWAILVIGMVIMVTSGAEAGRFYDTPTYPVTYAVLSLTSGSFALFFLIIITVYSGEMVWKERAIKFDQIYDAFPLPGYLTYLSRLSALMMVQIILIVVLIVTGILIQTYYGYYKFEIGLYLKEYFGIVLPDLLQLTALALLIQTLIKNKFAGHTVMVVFYIGRSFLFQMGYQHNLYIYARGARYIYSDMNGYGHFVKPLFWFNLYWTVAAALLAIVSILLISRGTDTDWPSRLKRASLSFHKPLKMVSALLLVLYLAIGGYIFYNTNRLNKYSDQNSDRDRQVNYEKQYKQYKDLPQPKIIATKIQVDLSPETRAFKAKGSYTLRNKTNSEIGALHLSIPMEEIKNIQLTRENKLELKDDDLGYQIYKLNAPLKPGEEMGLSFEVDYASRGFRNSGEFNELAANGTFFNNQTFTPGIGYKEDRELGNDDERKKRGLKEKADFPPPDNLAGRMTNYVANDADWMSFEAIVSTSPDQIAIAPGYLQREWQENGRRYFEYKMGETKMLNFFSIMSGRYEVKRDKWKDVNIEIYYHKDHAYNLNRMIEATKKGLDYFTENFSPYQHKQFRIIEFPRYATFAQSFPNTIPYSESIGFIARLDKEDDIDYPFYVTAHELAHQWWAHQVIGGSVQGSTLLSESLAQYSALMVMEKEFGKDNIRKFLKHELNGYLRGRSAERKRELPLARVEDQSYIYYQKGSVVLYALKDYIGEERLNGAIKKYVSAVAYQEPPYTSSIEFLNYLREATPDDQKYLIEDLFETITLFENRAVEATAKKTEDGKYLVHIKVSAKKYRAEGTGEEKPIQINDMIEIGIFSGNKKKEKVLHLQKYKINQSEMEFDIKVDEAPERAGIDPYNKLIDRNSDDNVIEVKE